MRKRLSTTFCILLMAVQPLLAESMLGLLERSYEQVERMQLDNGLTLLIKEDHKAPVAAVQIWVGTGAMHEGPFLGAGMSHYMEHMIFKGTPTRDTGEISGQIDLLGGRINAYTSIDRTVFYVTLPSAHWEEGLDVLSDAVLNAHFPTNEWEREKQVILNEMTMGEDDHSRQLYYLLMRTAYREHPYRHPVIGYRDIFKRITREDLLAFHQQHYIPDNMICVITGDVDAEEVRRAVTERFGDVEKRVAPLHLIPPEAKQVSGRVARKTGPYEVTRMMWAYRATAIDHPDTPALDVLASLIGHGRSSRLNRILKEEKKLVHSIQAFSYTPLDPGLFVISAEFEPDKESAVFAALNDELENWKQNGFTESEIEKARRIALTGELRTLRTADGQARSIASGQYYTGDPSFSISYLNAVERVDQSDLERVLNTYFKPSALTRVLLEPEGETPAAKQNRAADEIALKTKRLKLSNGMPLLVRPHHEMPFIYINYTGLGGLLTEPEEQNGINHLMAQLLTRGSRHYTAEELAREAEEKGGSIQSFSSRSVWGLSAEFLSEDAELFQDLFRESLLNPSFNEEEIAKQKTLQLAAIEKQSENPRELAKASLREAVYADHPYRHDVLGEAEDIPLITRRALQDYHAALLRAEKGVLAIFGDITEEEALAMGEAIAGSIPTGGQPTETVGTPFTHTAQRIEQTSPWNQTMLLIGFPGRSVSDPLRDELQVLSAALNGLSSTLGMEVREKRGLVYYIWAIHEAGRDPGLYYFMAGTQQHTAEAVEQEVLKEIERIKEKGLEPEELERAKQKVLGRYALKQQHEAALAQEAALYELMELGFEEAEKSIERIEGMTHDQIRRAAKDLFKPEHMVITLLNPEADKESGP